MTSQYDVICVGAGMVGAAIACGLARSDFKVAVIDPLLPPPYQEGERPHVRVSAISYASEQILKNLGAWSDIETKRTCPYRRLAVNEKHAETGLAAKLPNISNWARTEFDADTLGMTHLGHIIENDIVHAGLHSALKAAETVDMYCPSQLEKMDLSSPVKRLTLRSGEELTTKLVVGADGAQSRVRNEANLGQYRDKYEQHAFVCSVTYEGKQEDITWQSFTKTGPLAFLPLADSGGKHYASLVWYDLPDKVEQLASLDSSELMREIHREYPTELPKLLTIEETASFPLYKSHALNYVSQGVALAGDAAHTINPLAGQGVNLGFMDAAVLIEVLAAAKIDGEDFASVEVLKRYEKRRKSENQKMMSLMDFFYHSFSNDILPLRVARNLGLGLAQRSGLAKTKVMRYAIGADGNLPKLAKA